jgi:uncharacterized protein (DUF4415 family)
MKFKNPLSADALAKQAAALAQLPDEAIDFSDIPPLDDAFFNHALRAKFYRPLKEPTTIRLDADIKAWLKAQGRGYQTRLNDILRQAMMDEIQHKKHA